MGAGYPLGQLIGNEAPLGEESNDVHVAATAEQPESSQVQLIQEDEDIGGDEEEGYSGEGLVPDVGVGEGEQRKTVPGLGGGGVHELGTAAAELVGQ